MKLLSVLSRSLPSFVSKSAAQEHAGYVALSLTNLHFLPKPSPHKMLPFLCGARSVFSTTRLAAGGVLDAGKHITKEYMDTQENPAEILNTCTEGWESFEGKCYKVFLYDCLVLNPNLSFADVKFKTLIGFTFFLVLAVMCLFL